MIPRSRHLRVLAGLAALLVATGAIAVLMVLDDRVGNEVDALNKKLTRERLHIETVTAIRRDARKTHVKLLERWLAPHEKWAQLAPQIREMTEQVLSASTRFAVSPGGDPEEARERDELHTKLTLWSDQIRSVLTHGSGPEDLESLQQSMAGVDKCAESILKNNSDSAKANDEKEGALKQQTAQLRVALSVLFVGMALGLIAWVYASRVRRNSAARYRELFEHMTDAVAVYAAVDDGRDFVFREVNGASLRLEKLRYDEMVDHRLTELFPSIAQFGLLEVLTRVWQTGTPEHFPLGYYKDSRIEGWRENAVYRLPTREVVVVYRDVTERQRLESQLRQGQKLEAVGQLAAGIAHEINTPMQYISSNMTFLEEAFSDTAKLVADQQALADGAVRGGRAEAALATAFERAAATADWEYLRTATPTAIASCVEGVARVSEIVSAMKSFAYVGTGDTGPVDLNASISNTTIVARAEWNPVAELTTVLDPELPRVEGIASEINQVLLNLVRNATRAVADKVGESTDKGRIVISTHRIGDRVEVRIADSGVGIPEENAEKVFEPFFTTQSLGRGTGQGLATAYDIVVRKHHGKISFTSKLGKGTTFCVSLPALGADATTGES